MKHTDVYSFLSLGTDIVEVKRFVGLERNSTFVKKIFTKREFDECKKKRNPSESLAVRFAAKEAVRKCLQENTPFNKIEIRTTRRGNPVVYLLDKPARTRYYILLSLSHTQDLAHAVCIAIRIHSFCT